MNRVELRTRTLTGIGIGALTIGAIIASPFTFLIWLVCLAALATNEYLKLEASRASRVGLIMPTLFGTLVALFGLTIILEWDIWIDRAFILLFGFPILIILVFLVRYREYTSVELLTKHFKTAFGAGAYILLPTLAGCMFLQQPYRFIPILIPVILLWANDIGAYMIGSNWGKHKIAPLISPAKSVEGSLGGGVFTLIAAVLFSLVWPAIPLGYFIGLGIAVPVLALAGDLFESALKRKAGVKDSGTMLPGHGGILDRYDSFLFVLPAAVILHIIFAV